MDDDEDFCLGGIELPIGAGYSSSSDGSNVESDDIDKDRLNSNANHQDDSDNKFDHGGRVNLSLSGVGVGLVGSGTLSLGQKGSYPNHVALTESGSPQNKTHTHEAETYSSCRGSQKSSPKSACLPVDIDCSDDNIPFDLMIHHQDVQSDYEKCFLFLDYDGTLREFEDDPVQAIPSEELNYLLLILCDSPALREKVKTVIISGRDASFLDNYMGHHKALTLVAEHGYQVRRAYESDWTTLSSHDLDSLDVDWRETVLEQMKKVTTSGSTTGSFVEEKAKSIVWHYRAVNPPEEGDEGARNLVQFLELAGFPMERVSKGHKMIEVFGPQGPTKGACLLDLVIQFLNDVAETAKVLVFSAGDDVTDETMFAVSKDDIEYERARQKISDMVSVKVGNGKTGARYRVQNPVELRQVLSALIQKFSQPGPGSGQNQMHIPNSLMGSTVAPLNTVDVTNSPQFGYSNVAAAAAESSVSKPTIDSLFFAHPTQITPPNLRSLHVTSTSTLGPQGSNNSQSNDMGID